MQDISVRDLRTMYRSSLVMWKGIPVYVLDISDNYIFSVFCLKAQKTKNLVWKPENFTAPTVRIGYVNLGTNCIYCHRVPSRRYKVGLSTENVKVIVTSHPINDSEYDIAHYITSRLRSPQLYKALVGDYPSIHEAFSDAVENKGVVAFDKQFAVDFNMKIYFKGHKVGSYKMGDVEFDEGKEHLRRALISG